MAIGDLFETAVWHIERKYHVIRDSWVESDSVCVVDHEVWIIGILDFRFYQTVPNL
jgi:hypothetical protein